MHDRWVWSFLIPAAGGGTRAGTGPKAFLEIKGRTLLDWAVTKAQEISDDVVVALPIGSNLDLKRIYPNCRFIEGGATRQDSIKALLEQADRDWIIVHEVARPFASRDLIEAVAQAAIEGGAAGAFSPIDVPVAVIADGRVVNHHAFNEVGLFQTPQAFRKDILSSAYERASLDGRQERSTIQLVLKAGFDVRAVLGERQNIKITHPEDVPYAELLAERL